MQRAFDDVTNRLAQRLEAEAINPPPPVRRPSRLMMSATPAPGRLEAAAADTNVRQARYLMGEAWTNRLAALLPDGWRLGPCVGKGEGERFEPLCFDRLECTYLRGISKAGHGQYARHLTLNFLVENEDDGHVEHGQYEVDGGWCPHGTVNTFALCPGEHLTSMLCRFPGQSVYHSPLSVSFMTTAGREATLKARQYEGYPSSRFMMEAPPGLVIRSFYGRGRGSTPYVKTCALGVIYGPPTAVWRPGTPVRFSDAATARARAVIALADGEGPLGRLPEVLVHLVLAFAINLFPDYEVRGARRQLLDELETRPARSSDAG